MPRNLPRTGLWNKEMPELDRFETMFGPMFHRVDDEVIGKALRRYGQWAIDEIALIFRILRQTRGDFIDLGANVGTHTVGIATLLPEAEVFAFEANPQTFQILSTNITVNGLTNVRAFNYLVGGTSAMVRTVTNEADNPRNLGAVAFTPVSLGERSARLALQAAVDDVYPAARSVSFLKADIEGMEAPAFAGARATLERCKPAVYFENGARSSAGPLFNLLAELGYETFWHINYPFDKENYRGEAHNDYGGVVEIGTLGIHPSNDLIDHFRRSLTHTSQLIDEHAWHQCVALNAGLRAELKAQGTPRTRHAQLCHLLLDRYHRERTGTVLSSMEPPDGALPHFTEIRRALLLDVPDDALRALLRPMIAHVLLDEPAYLQRNPDVAAAVAAGHFTSAREHYVVAGYFEGRVA